MEFIRPKKPTLSLDMAPLIDVVFQLLIFFMLSSSFIAPAMRLNLPKAATRDDRDVEKIVLSIDRSGGYFLNEAKVFSEDLRRGIAAKLSYAKKKSIDLRGDGDVPYRFFVKAMDEARQAGASQINIVHEGESKP